MAASTTFDESMVDSLAKPRDKSRNTNAVVAMLERLASLKLTVFLFALSIFLVLVGTLAQDKVGIWEVMQKYFRSYVVRVPFNVFFPKAWAPSWQDVPGGFIFFGGRSLGIALAVNLLAAHLIRFKVRGRGMALVSGSLLFALGVFVCGIIIAFGSIKGGIQDQVSVPAWLVWYLPIVMAIVGMLVAAYFTIKKLGSSLVVRNWLLFTEGLVVVLSLAGLIMGLPDGAYIRILWQLEQGTIGGLILLAGSWLLFQRRAGIVVIHLGIGLLMFNELFVSVTNSEQQITVTEGEETSIARDIRSSEIAIVDRTDPEVDRETIVSQDWFRPGQVVALKDLPFDLRIERFFINSRLMSFAGASAEDTELVPECTQGLGMSLIAVQLNPLTGADSGVDASSVYVSVLNKKGEELATLLLPMIDMFDEPPQRPATHPIEVDGKTFYLSLRMPREIKPYSVQLLDVTQETYVGTDIASHYASVFRIRRSDDGSDLQGNIQMNEPLRYGGETFYQQSYFKSPDGTESSTLQVVTNVGWMMPYVACMIVAIGMVQHFLQTLVQRMGASRSAAVAAGEATLHDQVVAEMSSEPRGKSTKKELGAVPPVLTKREPWWPAAVAAGLVGFMLLGMASSSLRSSGEFDLVAAGKIPVTNNGRIMPLDSLARNSLRHLSKQETTRNPQGERVSAMQWYLDVVTHSTAADEYPVFKIQNLELLASMNLEKRSGFLYSFKELSPNLEELFEEEERIRSQTMGMGGAAQADLSRTEQATLDLARRIHSYDTLKLLHQSVKKNQESADDLGVTDALQAVMLAAGSIRDDNQVPLAIPSEGITPRGWETLAYFDARTKVTDVLKKLQSGRDDQPSGEINLLVSEATDELVETWSSKLMLDQYQREMMTKLQAEHPDWSSDQVMGELRRQVVAREFDPQVFQQIARSVQMAQANVQDSVVQAMNLVYASADGSVEEANLRVTELNHQPADIYRSILVAYRDVLPSKFNESIVNYQSYLREKMPEIRFSGVALESLHSRVAPFYLATVGYLFAVILAAVSWVIPRSGLRKAALATIVVALLFHTLGIVFRVIISERPPITNLYSSAIFIGWIIAIFSLLLESLTKLSIGNFVGSFVSAICLLIAWGLSVEGDTFAVMVAVLDTQFWLATHVICITMGYATTFVAGFMGVAFLVTSIVHRGFDKQRRRVFSGVVYGMVCFSLLFSFVGTVLGGLWADDSWGRFWGWDPKENGALIIVIWNALVLHARWGAMIRERGLAVLAVFGNVVTAWSWFGTNQLGFGLHSYGFTEGVVNLLGLFVLSQLIVMALGFVPPANRDLRSSRQAAV